MGLIALLLVLFAIGGALAYLVTVYNGLASVRNNVDKAWANIDVLLKQRHDELPNLSEVCKGYMKYEGETLQRVTAARVAYTQAATPDQKVQAGAAMSAALGKLIAVAENYPDLKANANFAHRPSRVTELESEIADRREFYNDSVNTYNVRIQQAPDMIVAGWMHLQPRQMFKVDEADKANVPMVFSTGAH